jgi:hypothetical protein
METPKVSLQLLWKRRSQAYLRAVDLANKSSVLKKESDEFIFTGGEALKNGSILITQGRDIQSQVEKNETAISDSKNRMNQLIADGTKFRNEAERLKSEAVKLINDGNRMLSDSTRIKIAAESKIAESEKLKSLIVNTLDQIVKDSTTAKDLVIKGEALKKEGETLINKGNKPLHDSELLAIEASVLRSESELLWQETLIDIGVKGSWVNYNSQYGSKECHLETGEKFTFENN